MVKLNEEIEFVLDVSEVYTGGEVVLFLAHQVNEYQKEMIIRGGCTGRRPQPAFTIKS